MFLNNYISSLVEIFKILNESHFGAVKNIFCTIFRRPISAPFSSHSKKYNYLETCKEFN